MFDPVFQTALLGNKFTLSIEDRVGKVQNFFKFDDIVTDMKEAMLEAALETQTLAYEFCAVNTGFMRDHLEVHTSPQMLIFEVGWRPEAFYEAGEDFYPFYVVFGTRHMVARDPLTPAYAATRPAYRAKVRAAMQEGIRRRKAGL